MRGVITGKDVVLHSVSIVRLWGMGTYLQCLWAAVTRTPSTFLEIISSAPSAPSAKWRPSR